MPLRKAARVGGVLLLLIALGFAARQLPVGRYVVLAARALHGLGPEGMLLTSLGIYALSLLLLPIIPLIIACGWLYGPWGALLSLPAAVASAATAFSLARALGGSAAAQALMERPRARDLATLAAEGGILTVVLIRVSPLLPFTPSNAVLGLTPLRLRHVVLGTLLGMGPGIFLYSWAGSMLPSAEAIESGEGLHGGLVYVMMGAALIAAAILAGAAVKRLRQRPV